MVIYFCRSSFKLQYKVCSLQKKILLLKVVIIINVENVRIDWDINNASSGAIFSHHNELYLSEAALDVFLPLRNIMYT